MNKDNRIDDELLENVNGGAKKKARTLVHKSTDKSKY